MCVTANSDDPGANFIPADAGGERQTEGQGLIHIIGGTSSRILMKFFLQKVCVGVALWKNNINPE